MVEALRTHLTHGHNRGPRHVHKVTNDVWSPVTVPDHSHSYHNCSLHWGLKFPELLIFQLQLLYAVDWRSIASEDMAKYHGQSFAHCTPNSHLAGAGFHIVPKYHRNFMNNGIEGFQFKQELCHTRKTRLMNKLVPITIKSSLDQLSSIRSIARGIVTNPRNSHQNSEK